MKKITCFTVIVLMSICLSAQTTRPDSLYFMEKSNRQKKAGFIVLGCGITTLFAGTVVLANIEPGWEHVNWKNVRTGLGLLVVGVATTAVSISLFSDAKRNAERARWMDVSIKSMEVNTDLFAKNIPAVSVTIPLR